MNRILKWTDVLTMLDAKVVVRSEHKDVSEWCVMLNLTTHSTPKERHLSHKPCGCPSRKDCFGAKFIVNSKEGRAGNRVSQKLSMRKLPLYGSHVNRKRMRWISFLLIFVANRKESYPSLGAQSMHNLLWGSDIAALCCNFCKSMAM